LTRSEAPGEPAGRSRVGVVGCGKISEVYLRTMGQIPGLEVTAVADLDPARAREATELCPTSRAEPVEELLVDDDVDIVVNLTVPAAHAEICTAALRAGKHTYTEKPLALDAVSGREMMALAAARSLRVGAAPDTVLGTGTQTARAVIDRGGIGTPVAATAFMASHGPESWHPRPYFYYQPGGGPLLDMGPYYLSALVHLLGPVTRVTGAAHRGNPEREVGSGPDAGTRFPVEIDTHVTGLLEHDSGAVTTLVTSFEAWASRLPRIEVYGTEGSLSAPDPNRFDGTVEIFTPGRPEWTVVPASAGFVDAARGVGVADLARSLTRSAPPTASGELGQHVLEVMDGLLRSAHTATSIDIAAIAGRPPAVPLLPHTEAATRP
jgi:predicted dehydrogenase